MKFIELIKSMQKWIIKLNRKDVQKEICKLQIFLIGLLVFISLDANAESSTNYVISIICYSIIIAIMTTVLINTNIDVLFSAKSFFWASMKNSFILVILMLCIFAVVLENDEMIAYFAIVICFIVAWCILSLITHNRVGAYVNAVCAIVLQLIFTIANTFISLLPDDYKLDFFIETGIYNSYNSTRDILNNMVNLFILPLLISNSLATVACLIKKYYFETKIGDIDTLDLIQKESEEENEKENDDKNTKEIIEENKHKCKVKKVSIKCNKQFHK